MVRDLGFRSALFAATIAACGTGPNDGDGTESTSGDGSASSAGAGSDGEAGDPGGEVGSSAEGSAGETGTGSSSSTTSGASTSSGTSTNSGTSTSTGTEGGDETTGGDPGDGPCGPVPAPAARGATVPYFEIEAEDAQTDGVVIGPSRTFGEVAAEASGRRAVRLEASGQGVELVTEHATNSIVVRFSIPDTESGGGATATLGLYVDGVRTDLELTSRYAWTYGDADAQGPGADVPGNGTPHHFFDEAHVLFDEVPAGTTIALRRDDQDTAAFYVIDLIDLEKVCPPLAQPMDSLSIGDHGAIADDGIDDGPAIQAAIDAARDQGKVLWIPAGAFDVEASPLNTSGVTIRGAGRWHSTLRGNAARFRVSGDDNRFHDFAVFGEVTFRDDGQPNNGFDGPAGTGSILENVWIEHHKVGWWVGKGGFGGVPTEALTDGLQIRGVRIRNTFADGINFVNGTRNSIVEHSNLRNTGDDALATWSPSFDGPAGENNVFRHNTVQVVWRATCFGIYGGKDHRIEDNLCEDTSNYPGIFLATTSAFSPWPFSGTTVVERNTLVRAGGPHYGYDHGAFRIYTDALPIQGVRVAELDIEDATFFGLHFEGTQAITDVVLDGVDVDGYGTAGIWVAGNASGTVQASNVVVTGGTGEGLRNDAGANFAFDRGPGNSGW